MAKGDRDYGPMGGGFTNARKYGKEDPGSVKYPAEFNVLGVRNQTKTINEIIKKYITADREYGLSVDEHGFTHRHVEGQRTSVAISAAGENHMVVHNHPSGGSFSKSDLLNMSQDRSASGVVAVGRRDNRNYIYKAQKTNKFDAVGWSKAVSRAKWPKKLDYSDGVQWWMRRNASKYGVKFSQTSKPVRGATPQVTRTGVK